MDRNSIVGFVLLALLLFGYLYFNSRDNLRYEADKKRREDSTAIANRQKEALLNKKDSGVILPVRDTSYTGKIFNGDEKLLTVENEVLKIVFTSKGGQPKTVHLKKHISNDGAPVQMVNGATDNFSYRINAAGKGGCPIADLFFAEGTVVKNADNSQTITFPLAFPGGETVVHQYVLKSNEYMLDWNVDFKKADVLLTNNTFGLQWNTTPQRHEKEVYYERQQSQIVFMQEDEDDYFSLYKKTENKFEKPIHWLSLKQQFFNSTLILKNKFEGGQITWAQYAKDDTAHANVITKASATLNTKLPDGALANIPMQLYYGPNDYNILRNNGVKNMDKIVNLGQGMYTFVRPLNQFVILPVFNFIKKFIGSYGLVIALLTLFIRLITSPLMYPGYLTSAKMKILRPELDELKKKFPDQQEYAMEQMKFMRQAGVNSMAGCLPSLLQIPIFFALFSFFNSNVALRGQEFLWSKNLAAYDSILDFGFNIWGYGNHISLFTIFAVLTSFLISLYQMNSTPDAGNPALKYMPYIFPIMMLSFFNDLPSALTWYYTVSNVITLILQWVIKTFIINHEKLITQIEENRKKPKTRSRFQERMEQMQEMQKKMQDAKARGQGGK